MESLDLKDKKLKNFQFHLLSDKDLTETESSQQTFVVRGSLMSFYKPSCGGEESDSLGWCLRVVRMMIKLIVR